MATKKAYYSELDRGEPMMFDSEGNVANPLKVKDKPFTGEGSTYIGGSGLPSKAGAGRSGGKGGPTAKELKKYEDKLNAGIYTSEKGQPPSPREMAKGGSVSSASKRADGIATKGKTRGKMC